MTTHLAVPKAPPPIPPSRHSDARLHVLLLLARLGLALVVAVGIAVPVLAYRYFHHIVLLGQQGRVPSVTLTQAELTQYQRFAASGPPTFVTLGYSDIGTHGRSDDSRITQTVQAADFAHELAMLKAAGFVSIDAQQVVSYLQGNYTLPKHAALISFDGARERDWTEADRILGAYHDRAIVFVDPTVITSKRTPYLSWTQLRTMAASGRWSLGLDIAAAAAARQVVIDAHGTTGPAVVEHQWLQAKGRAETAAEYKSRIKTMLDSELAILTKQHLPRPRLLSQPFAAGYPLARVSSTFDELTSVAGSMFTGSLINLVPDQSVDKQYRAERLLPRLQVYGSTSTQELFSRIEAAS
ncbi:MAG: hypothetical protein ACRDV3_09740 [Acidothermaceae bacterium]